MTKLIVMADASLEICGIEVNSNKVIHNKLEKNDQKMSKSKKLSKFKKMVGSLNFLILGARLVFIKLR